MRRTPAAVCFLASELLEARRLQLGVRAIP
jgi:hypothetical protein